MTESEARTGAILLREAQEMIRYNVDRPGVVPAAQVLQAGEVIRRVWAWVLAELPTTDG